MEKDTLEVVVRDCALRIWMNDGRDYLIEKPEFFTIGGYTASILLRRDGAMRSRCCR